MGGGPVNIHGGPVIVGSELVWLVWPIASMVCSKKRAVCPLTAMLGSSGSGSLGLLEAVLGLLKWVRGS